MATASPDCITGVEDDVNGVVVAVVVEAVTGAVLVPSGA
jgi:hypothetical protein